MEEEQADEGFEDDGKDLTIGTVSDDLPSSTLPSTTLPVVLFPIQLHFLSPGVLSLMSWICFLAF